MRLESNASDTGDTTRFSHLQATGIFFQGLEKHSDAIGWYERALQSPIHEEEKRLDALFHLGMSYYQIGRFPDALKVFAEVYLLGGRLKATQRCSHLSYVYMIIILRWIVRVTREHSSIHYGFRLIDKELRSLEETGRHDWRAPLLLEKAIFSDYNGGTMVALDLAEESYQLARINRTISWPLGYHGMMLSRFSRSLGDYERCLVVLEESEPRFHSTYSTIQVQTERLRVLQAMRGRLSEVIDLARILERSIPRITSPRTIVEAHLEVATAFLSSGSCNEGISHLNTAGETVLSDQAFHRPCLVMEMSDTLKRSGVLHRSLPASTEEQIARWSQKIEEETQKIHAFWEKCL